MYTIIFGQLSPKKPNAGKRMQQMRVYILFFNSEILYKKQTGIFLQKTPEIDSPVPSGEFLPPGRPTISLCVTLHSSLRSPCVGLHHSTWAHCAATLHCLLWAYASLSPLSLLTPSPSYASATFPCNSPSEIEFYSFRIDFLRVSECVPGLLSK